MGPSFAFAQNGFFYFHPTNHDLLIEQQAIAIQTKIYEIIVINKYIPPATSCPSGFKANIQHLLTYDGYIILGDV